MMDPHYETVTHIGVARAAAIDAKTDEDIRRAIAEDPDAAPEFQPGEMERLIREGKARIVRPVKKPI